MTSQPADVYDLLQKIRYDCTAIQAKVTDALNVLRDLQLPDQPAAKCFVCGLETRGQRTLEEHLHQMHDGPEPAHWQELDAAIDESGVAA